MQIFIKNTKGEQNIIEVELSDSIKSIKQKYQEKTDIKVEFNFVFGGKQLEDHQTLQDYKINKGATLNIVIPLKGGLGVYASCLFNALEKPISVNYSLNAPKWNLACLGMNLSGKCENSLCEAFGKRVICCKGYGKFNIHKESVTSECPICKVFVKECDNVYFSMCEYTVFGQQKDEAKAKSYTKRVEGKNSCETFKNKDGDKREWIFLEIEVKRI